MQLSDSSGHIRYLLCSAVLFIYHGLRDYIITGLPHVTAAPNDPKLYAWKSDDSTNGTAPSSPDFVLNTDDGWSDAYVGGVLSGFYWGSLLPLAASPFIISRWPLKYLLLISLGTSGLLSLFSELASKGPTGLLILRMLQGITQGLCYPIVLCVLEGVPTSATFVIPYFFVFLAPWLGSVLGALLGLAENSFTGGYLFGSLSILVGIISIFVPTNWKDLEKKPSYVWKECLTSPAVWSCIFLQFATVWSLHLFLVGLSFTICYKLQLSYLLWSVSLIILIGGLSARFIAMTAMNLIRNHFLSPLNRRRFINVLGCAIIGISFIVNGLKGIHSDSVLIGLSCLGVIGVGISLVGVRLNLHDLGPLFSTPLLILGSIGSTAGAGTASLLFPIMAQLHNTVGDNDGPWKVAWIVPIAVVIVACIAYLFLISVIPLNHQILISKNSVKPVSIIRMNGTPSNVDEADAKSFKSTKSAISFKSAVSRHRTRTVSFKTVDENVEADLHSIIDSITKGDDCVSINLDDDEGEDDNQDMKSVKSAATSFKSGVTSFKSANEAGRDSIDAGQYGVVLNVEDLDRTTAWLSTHHTTTGITIERNVPDEIEIVERNILIAMLW